MKKPVFIAAVIIVSIAGVAAGIVVNQWINKPVTVTTAAPKNITPEIRPDFGLLDLEDTLRHASDWDGQVVMINFWATWCPPCRKEIPAFIKLQDAYEKQGFTIVGIAIDTKQNAIDFVDPMGINYPILVGDKKGIDLAKAYGNRYGVLPYTVIVDRNGKIIYTHRNELTFAEAEKIIKPLL